MGKQHAPGFLKIVQDAKTRVKECTVDDVKKRLDAGDRFTLVDVRDTRESVSWRGPYSTGRPKNVPRTRMSR